MKSIKTIIKVSVTLLACVSFVMMTAEAKSVAMQLAVSGGSALVLAICAKILSAMGAFDK